MISENMFNMTRKQTRLSACILLIVLLLSALLPLSVSADASADGDTAASKDCYVEPTVIRADNYALCTTGFSLYVDNPDNLPLNVTCSVYASDDLTGAVDAGDWITVSLMEQSSENDEAANRPSCVVDFHKPADITVEDPAFIDVPAFLRPVSVSGNTIYALDPAFTLDFHVTGGEAAEDGTYPLDFHMTGSSDSAGTAFDLERPQKLIVNLNPGYINPDDDDAATAGNSSGSISTYFYLPKSIRTLLSSLRDDRSAFLSSAGSYGREITDAAVYVQYDFTTLDTPSSYDAEAEAGGDALYSMSNLYEIDPSVTSILCSADYLFADETFRACFPEETFTETSCQVLSVDGEKIDIDGAPEIYTYITLDTEKVTLTTRVRFVLALTAADGTVYYNTSGFTDPVSCGASNSLVSEPSSMEAPVLSDALFSTDESGATILSFHVTANDSIRETAVWLAANKRAGVGYKIEISVNGSEWKSYSAEPLSAPDTLLDGDWALTVSDEDINDYAYIRIQMSYTAPISDEVTLQSVWSVPLAFDKKPEETVTAPDTYYTIPLYSETEAGDGELKYICPICGICPAPYGVCLFLWIGAALLLVLLVVLIIALIPKKKGCPRCHTACRSGDKSCPVCGYRFVGSMPEIEETTGDLSLSAKQESPVHDDDAFYAAMKAPEGTAKQNSETTAETAASAKPASPARPAEAANPSASADMQSGHISLPQADAAFLAELKRKMTAVKAGEKLSFTPAEIAYIKALKERKAAAQAQQAQQTQQNAVRKTAAPQNADQPKTAVPDTAAAKQEESREEQIARLRALRAKQLAENEAEPVQPVQPQQKAQDEKPVPPTPGKAEKPVRQIKCPACAVPNPETNERCYICGTRLK